jgi:23S rRNA pseudouridine1911/1915/1917 synthase
MYLSEKENDNELVVLNISGENSIFEKKRLDFFLKSKFENYSRSYFQKLLQNDLIFVNSKIEPASYKLKKDDIIEIKNLNALEISQTLKPENIKIDIIFEDDDIVVINKPAMMVVHPACGNFSGTLVNALCYHFENLPNSEKNKDIMSWSRPGLVHRLDKETSGIIIIAKNENSLINLAKQFEKRKVHKTYLAICYAKTDLSQGKINIAISRSKIDRKKMSVASSSDESAKPSITNFKVIQKLTNSLVVIEAKPETGRTHQIRVHLQYTGYPILNDSVYGVSLKNFKKIFPNIEERTLLHAHKIEFFHPRTNEKICLEAKIPEDFESIINLYSIK